MVPQAIGAATVGEREVVVNLALPVAPVSWVMSGCMDDAAVANPTLEPVSWELVQRLTSGESFAAIRHQNDPFVDVYLGPVQHASTLDQIPLRGSDHRGVDVVAALPFAQVRERGFPAHGQETPLSYLVVHTHVRVSVEDFLAAFPAAPVQCGPASYDLDDQAYAQLVQRVVTEEIGNGEGANFVVRRTLSTQIADWSPSAALGLLSRLLVGERGAYATFLVNLGTRMLLGASPERHLSARGGEVMMNPISGTFRLPSRPVSDAELTALLEDFLRDEKEILELMMVVDEELKMMAALCPEGGRVIGPLLKQMSHLVHTEYLLHGHCDLPVIDLLRGSMFAATVVGSPLGNACRVVAQYEGSDRGYYGAVLAELGRDHAGPTVDAPILIRTADIASDGTVSISVGATLVRDSVGSHEAAETRAKVGGLLTAMGLQEQQRPAPRWPEVSSLIVPDAPVLQQRNARLSPFWIQHSPPAAGESFAGLSVALVSAEDDFAAMLAHLLRRLGLEVSVVSWSEWGPNSEVEQDILLMGPGPGDPRDPSSQRMATARRLVRSRLEARRPLLAVCLGHQILADALGFPLTRQRVVVQGAQRQVVAFGRQRWGGFYNTFTAIDDGTGPADCQVWAHDGEIVALAGPYYAGLQFHPESILTPQGVEVLTDALNAALGRVDPASWGEQDSGPRA